MKTQRRVLWDEACGLALCVFQHDVSYGEVEMGKGILCEVHVQEMRVRVCDLQQTFFTLPLQCRQTKLGSRCGMLTEQR